MEILAVVFIIGFLFFSPRENVDRNRDQVMSDEEVQRYIDP